MVAPTYFDITLPSSGSVPSAFWEMINWGAVNRILWMGVLCLVTWCTPRNFHIWYLPSSSFILKPHNNCWQVQIVKFTVKECCWFNSYLLLPFLTHNSSCGAFLSDRNFEIFHLLDCQQWMLKNSLERLHTNIILYLQSNTSYFF
jgi:hypothetical protein